MNNLKANTSKILIAFLLPGLISFSIIGCGNSSTDTNPPPDGISFDSGIMADGETFSFTFQEEETVEYFCQIHTPDMQGVVIVSNDADISGEFTIVMEGLAFNPSSVTVTPGTTIIWENQDGVNHDLKSGNPNNGGGNGGPY